MRGWREFNVLKFSRAQSLREESGLNRQSQTSVDEERTAGQYNSLSSLLDPTCATWVGEYSRAQSLPADIDLTQWTP